MFSKLKSVFAKEENPETSPTDFKHPNTTMEGDVSQCPFMRNKQSGITQKQKTTNKNSDSESSQEEEKPKGGCPFMATSGKKKNPNLGIQQSGYDEPYVSKFKYYLSANKLNLDVMRTGKEQNCANRVVFNSYPIYLKHTLFYNGENYNKVRSFECCSRFLAYQDLRERGNKFFNKGKYSKALDFYERAMSLYRWLEYRETKIAQTDLAIEELPSKSEISDEQEISSKIHLRLGEISSKNNKGIEDRDKQFAELSSKYKQLFVVYNDDNVEYHNGEDMNTQADIQMRNSVLIQIYLNMAAAYIKLNNYSLAKKVIEDGFELTDHVSQLYLRKSQAIVCDLSSDLKNLEEAKAIIEKAIEMRPEEKIFKTTNKNMLKMINIHDAEEVYSQVLQQIQERMNILKGFIGQKKQAIQQRLAYINQAEKEIVLKGKVPEQSSRKQLFSVTSQFKILLRMHQKYIKVIQFYSEARNKEQIALSKNQFQEVLRILTQVKFIENIKIEKDEQKYGRNSQKVYNRLQNTKRKLCEEIYDEGNFNFQVLQWAIKQIVKEQRQEQQRAAEDKESDKEEKTSTNFNSFQQNICKQRKNYAMSTLPYAMVLVPLLGFAVNHYLF